MEPHELEAFSLENAFMGTFSYGRASFMEMSFRDMLSEDYHSVITPIRPPYTHNFGMLQVFLFDRKEPLEDKVQEFKAIAASVMGVLKSHDKDTASVVVPLGPVSESDPCLLDETVDMTNPNLHMCYRVDITICSSLDSAEWKSFMRNHAFFCKLLSSIVRPFGLIMNDDGFFVSLAPEQNDDSPEASLFLSAEPSRVLHFLGLKPDIFCTQEFRNLCSMFWYIADCPFAVSDLAQNRNFSLPADDTTPDVEPLKQTGRVLRSWYRVFMPSFLDGMIFELPNISQEEAVEAAILVFGVAEEYYRKQEEFQNAN